MNDHGKPGACIEMKPESLEFRFVEDGTWSSAANDANQTKHAGTYELRGDRLILKNADGSHYLDWHTDLSADGKRLLAADKKLIETFDRV